MCSSSTTCRFVLCVFTDVNECNFGSHVCDVDHGVCANTDGGYTCSCKGGYEGDGATCTGVYGGRVRGRGWWCYMHRCVGTRGGITCTGLYAVGYEGLCYVYRCVYREGTRGWYNVYRCVCREGTRGWFYMYRCVYREGTREMVLHLRVGMHGGCEGNDLMCTWRTYSSHLSLLQRISLFKRGDQRIYY